MLARLLHPLAQVVGILDQQRCEYQGENPDRYIDEEDPPPLVIVRDPAAQGGADCRRHHHGHTVDGERHPQPLPRKRVSQDRLRYWLQTTAARTLDYPEQDQHRYRGSHAT
jgi:hypothetical protein